MSFPKISSLITTLNKLSELLSQRSHHGYIVGGFIRDWLLDRQTNDIDIAVDGNALSIAREVAKELRGKFVLLDETNGIARVVVVEGERNEWHLDFSSFSGDIKSDLARRDFTINAMATALDQFVIASEAKQSQINLVDPFSGKKDLENRIVRAVNDQIFEADAVRLLRAVRLAAELDFAIEPETEGLIRRYSQSITKIPGERVREESLRLLTLPKAAHHLEYLDQLGLLLALIPELKESKGVEQPTVHFWDVFDHSIQTVAAVEFLIRESDWEYGNRGILTIAPWSDTIEAHLSQEISHGSNRKVLLKLGGLLHDIAKPKTKSVDDTGRARFLGHTNQGAAMTASILERLRFSRREIDLVETLVYYHLRPAQMTNKGAPKNSENFWVEDKELPSQRAIYRYFRDTGDASIDILLLALADYLASRGPLVNMEEWKEHCRLINYILTEHDNQQVKITPVKLIDGHDLMDVFGLTPGPLIGELLALVREAQASGELTNREEALALVQGELHKRADPCLPKGEVR